MLVDAAEVVFVEREQLRQLAARAPGGPILFVDVLAGELRRCLSSNSSSAVASR